MPLFSVNSLLLLLYLSKILPTVKNNSYTCVLSVLGGVHVTMRKFVGSPFYYYSHMLHQVQNMSCSDKHEHHKLECLSLC